METILIFFGLSLVNVVLQTLKSIFTIRASKMVAALTTAIAFGFYTVVIKQLSDFDLVIAVVVTVVANLIGVYLSIVITEKLKKDDLWKITAVLSQGNVAVLEIRLKYHKIGFTSENLNNGKMKFDIYAYTQNESAIVKNILDETPCKSHYVPVKTF